MANCVMRMVPSRIPTRKKIYLRGEPSSNLAKGETCETWNSSEFAQSILTSRSEDSVESTNAAKVKPSQAAAPQFQKRCEVGGRKKLRPRVRTHKTNGKSGISERQQETYWTGDNVKIRAGWTLWMKRDGDEWTLQYLRGKERQNTDVLPSQLWSGPFSIISSPPIRGANLDEVSLLGRRWNRLFRGFVLRCVFTPQLKSRKEFKSRNHQTLFPWVHLVPIQVVSGEKRQTNFRVKGIEDLWILKDQEHVSGELLSDPEGWLFFTFLEVAGCLFRYVFVDVCSFTHIWTSVSEIAFSG